MIGRTRENSPSSIAADIVLLLPDDIMKMAIELNQGLAQPVDDRIDLSSVDCLPHISLAMTAIDSSAISQLSASLDQLAQDFLPLELEISGSYKKSSTGLTITKTSLIQKLHEHAWNLLKPLALPEVTAEMFYQAKDGIDQTTIDWVKDYGLRHGGSDQYFPHITIGEGAIETSINRQVFFATEIALCQLGNHGTCRKVLAISEVSK